MSDVRPIDSAATYAPREAASLLAIEYRVVRAAIQAGRLPTIGSGVDRRVSGAALLAWDLPSEPPPIPSAARRRTADLSAIGKLLKRLPAAEVAAVRAFVERLAGVDRDDARRREG